MTLSEFAAEIELKQRAARAAKSAAPWHPAATPASSLGYRCLRRHIYTRCLPDLAAPPSEELASIFSEGRLHEAATRRELSELGYEVLEGEVQFHDEHLDLRGTIDGRIKTPWGAKVPVEIKSWSGEGPRTEEQWRNNEGSLMRRYFDQLQTYLYLCSEPEGLLLTKNKLTGLWAVCAARLDYAYAESLLQRAEAIRDLVKAWRAANEKDAAMPERIPDRSECNGCPFALHCLPADAPVDPLQIAKDEELAAQLEKRETLAADAKLFDKLDGGIKERVKLTNCDRFICGGFEVSKKKSSNGSVRVKIERLPLAAKSA